MKRELQFRVANNCLLVLRLFERDDGKGKLEATPVLNGEKLDWATFILMSGHSVEECERVLDRITMGVPPQKAFEGP